MCTPSERGRLCAGPWFLIGTAARPKSSSPLQLQLTMQRQEAHWSQV
eukprot:CAMPEP_0185904564 /NCGR_PEP_ID=MMETSP0196C-20130402/3854_1 /TAXON_ID=2932 /ORGANISM="Alexandrium fundyense, Strain CCMP1719" /LENGTH=46 /DNA_ID= /DNA_START= /DNA_END= /DNA_ORIENTATION=